MTCVVGGSRRGGISASFVAPLPPTPPPIDGMSAERDRNAPADVPPAAATVRGEMEMDDDDDDDDCCEGAAATGRGETALSPRWEERFLAALIRTLTVDGIEYVTGYYVPLRPQLPQVPMVRYRT